MRHQPQGAADGDLALVVDDDIELRALVCEMLGADGFRTVTALDGEEALTVARQSQPALIVLDVVMRGMDGLTALSQLRADALTRQIPVIVMTGQEEEIYRILSVGGGAVAHLTKPFAPGQLLDVVRELRLAAPPAGARPSR